MAYIKVDHSKFEETASAIDTYVSLMKNNMRGAQGEVTSLSSSWQGADSTQFRTEVDKVDNEDSTHTRMVKSLESYAYYLRFAANKYKDAQARAINRANGLPRW